MRPHEAVDPPVLEPGEVHLWWSRVPEGAGEPGPGRDPEGLSDAERDRSEAFRTPLLRRRYVFRRMSVRRLCASYLGLAPEAVRFAAGEHGKPRIEAPGGAPCFNLSHTGDWLVIAVAAPGREVGVDVEALDRRGDFASVARRVFTPRELDELEGLASEPWREAFLRGWTRKEAILKALGTGLLREPREVHVGLRARAGESPWAPEDPALGSGWGLLDCAAPEGHAAAVAARGRDWRIRTVVASRS